MKRFIRKIGLYDSFTVELEITPQEFANQLAKITDSYVSDLSDIFSFNKKEYKGTIELERFSLLRRKSMISFDHYAEAYGTITQNGNKLTIETEVWPKHSYFVLGALGLVSLFFSTCVLAAFVTAALDANVDTLYVGLAFLATGGIVIGPLVLISVWSIKTLKADLSEEFKRFA